MLIRFVWLAVLLGLPTLNAGEPAKLPPINLRLKQDAAAAPLSMRFKGTTADECRTWQKGLHRQA